jgi:hypothetical protein
MEMNKEMETRYFNTEKRRPISGAVRAIGASKST